MQVMLKRSWSAPLALLVTATLFAGCGTQNGAPPAQVLDPHDILFIQPAGSHPLLVIAATGGNELRVVDLGLARQDFVRAPNPLEPLSIPTLDQPVGLVADTSYAGGAPVTGPYVYVRGTGAQQISVVDFSTTSDGGFTEVNRIAAPGVVTALAARGPDSVNPSSRLYAATYDGTRASLWEYDLPGVNAIHGAALNPSFLISTLPGETIAALLAIPSSPELVIATRASASGGGSTVAFNTSTRGVRPLQFPAPVRFLKSHPAIASVPPTPEGSYIFAILDEASCGGQLGCRGIMAVNTATGKVAIDGTGQPMIPLQTNSGPITGFDLIPNGPLHTQVFFGDAGCPGSFGNCIYPLLGMATTAGTPDSAGTVGGEFFFFDAFRFQLFGDVIPLTDGGITGFSLLGADGVTSLIPIAGSGPDLSSLRLQTGAARTETLALVYEPILPQLQGIQSLSTDGGFLPTDGVTVRVDPLSPPVSTVQPQDTVELSGITDSGVPNGLCDVKVRVSAVSVPPAIPGIILDSATPIPPQCQGFTQFSVRANGPQPFLVVGSTSGYLGRVGPNQTFAGGSYYYHPDGFNPTTPGFAFHMLGLDPQLTPDARYLIGVDAAFTNYFFWPDPALLSSGGIPVGLVPNSVASWLVGDPGTTSVEQIFVTYPARNGVLQLDLTRFVPIPNRIMPFNELFFFGAG